MYNWHHIHLKFGFKSAGINLEMFYLILTQERFAELQHLYNI